MEHIETQLLDMAAIDLDFPIADWWSHDVANLRCRRYASLVEQLLRRV